VWRGGLRNFRAAACANGTVVDLVADPKVRQTRRKILHAPLDVRAKEYCGNIGRGAAVYSIVDFDAIASVERLNSDNDCDAISSQPSLRARARPMFHTTSFCLLGRNARRIAWAELPKSLICRVDARI